jgi:hypothetical protein
VDVVATGGGGYVVSAHGTDVSVQTPGQALAEAVATAAQKTTARTTR